MSGAEQVELKKDWKYYMGLTLFIYSFCPIGLAVLIPILPVSKATATLLVTAIIASSEISFIISVALLGKPFVHTLKNKIRECFRRAVVPGVPKPISKTRHAIGLVMLFISFLPYYVTESALIWVDLEKLGTGPLIALMIGGDIIFITSLFVLGGEFWDRLKKLFTWPEPA